MQATEAGLEPGEAIWYCMDVHMYLNHIDQAKEQLSRTPRPWPTLRIKRKAPSLFDYTLDDFELEGEAREQRSFRQPRVKGSPGWREPSSPRSRISRCGWRTDIRHRWRRSAG